MITRCAVPRGTRLTNAVHVTAARLRFGVKPHGHGGVAARDGGRYCDTRLQFCTTERHQEGMIQS